MHAIEKMCRICLGQGSHDIFENDSLNSDSCDPGRPERIAEKLRYVTLLKVNPNDNLPPKICDACVAHLNVSYSLKRMALKNNFSMHQYLIENGISFTKNEDDDSGLESNASGLEINQIQNAIRERYAFTDDIRRNSTTSSISGLSALLMNGRENNPTPSIGNSQISTANQLFAQPRPIMRPIQVKIEPVDPDDQSSSNSSASLATPSSSTSSSNSVLTVNSTKPSRSPPMIVINGDFNLSNTGEILKTGTSSSKTSMPSIKEQPVERPRTRSYAMKVDKPERPIRGKDKKKIANAMLQTLSFHLINKEIDFQKQVGTSPIKSFSKINIKEELSKRLTRSKKNPAIQASKGS